ncbi:protein HGV2-like isoform X4 [Dreissena polymorpha]|uniref:protein HGV2-like isoform X4 n=1 Tax=Dreissena polymorpha TaxID=45954 RepID=UPI0022655CD0|nr:protein HGV2-like isoform X4 [Dreissena polymorpha]
MDTEGTSTSTEKDRMAATESAVNILAQGKRNMVCGEIPTAVNQFQEACRILSKAYGETAKECADAYFCYGQALLDLARMENGVLGNALQGVPDTDDESAEQKDEQFEKADLKDEEREKLRKEVYDAMGEKEEEKKDREKKEHDKKETGETMEVAMDGEDRVDDKDRARSRSKDRARSRSKDRARSSSKDKDVEKERRDEKEDGKDKDREKRDASRERRDASKERRDESLERKSRKDGRKDREKRDGSTEKRDDSRERRDDSREKRDDSREKRDDSREKRDDSREKRDDSREKRDEHKERERRDGSLERRDERKSDRKTEVKEDADKKEEGERTEEEGERTEESGDEREGEDAEGEEGTEEEGEATEEEAVATEGEAGETTSQDGSQDGENPDDVSNLQLAWEMLELAKLIYSKDESREAKLRAAESHLKLGEVSLETEQYEEAIKDLNRCLEIQKELLEADNRLLAETYYQLGLAYCFNKNFTESTESYRAAIKVIEDRVANLNKVLEAATEEERETSDFDHPVYKAKKEIGELREILPDITAKIEDVEDERKNLGDLKNLAKEALGGLSSSSEDREHKEEKPREEDREVKAASDISHLIKRKVPRKSEDVDDDTAKKAKSDEDGAGDTPKENGRREQEEKREEDMETRS